MIVAIVHHAIGALAVVALAAAVCMVCVLLLRPLLQRYALARPNARSSHVTPTPQGGGIAVMIAVAAGAAVAGLDQTVMIVLIAAFGLATIGLIDDLRPIPVIPRLALQAATLVALFVCLPVQARIFESMPLPLERTLAVLALLWFVNIVNFMDGLDWMTVAEIFPLAVVLAAAGFFGAAPGVQPVALGLAGAMIGFAPFNRPVAQLFLGDVGSLPIGLLTGWCLLELAEHRHLAAAIILPLYYLADATITLFRRMLHREQFWNAHRSHFYQRATDNGFSVRQIVVSVFCLNLLLAALAAASIMIGSIAADIATLMLAGVGVGALLYRFSRKQNR